jgi:hypothetical protein
MSNYQELRELPIALSAGDVARILGLSRAGAYNLLDEQGFPTLRVGKRKIVMRDKFIEWLDTHVGESV